MREQEEQLDIALLGEFRITRSGSTTLLDLPRKPRALLAALALSDVRAVARERLADLLWEASPPAQARGNLRQALARIRRCIGDGLVSDTESVGLDRSRVGVDADRFRQLVAAREPEAAEQALDLYRGDLLAGFSLREEAFEAWLRLERQRYRVMVIETMHLLLDHRLGGPDIEGLASVAYRLLAVDPLDEKAHLAVMRAHAAQGRHDAALRQYDECRSILSRELGVEPMEDLRQAVSEIRQQRRVIGAPAQQSQRATPTESTPVDEVPVIAVLRLRGVPLAEAADELAEALSEELIVELGRFPWLGVISPESSFEVDDAKGSQQAAADLGARYVLEGSLHRGSDRIRVTVRLTDAVSRRQVWADRFDEQWQDVLALLAEIAAIVANATAAEVETAETSRAMRRQAASPSLHERAFRARALLARGRRTAEPGPIAQAIEAAEEILSIDPAHVQALVVLSWAHFYRFLCRWPPAPERSRDVALHYADAVLGIDPLDTDALTVRGETKAAAGDLEGALMDFRRAVSTNPSSTWTLAFMSCVEAALGDSAAAREHARRSVRLNPRDSGIGTGAAHLGLALADFVDGDLEGSVGAVEVAITAHPFAPWRRVLAVAAYNLMGQERKARRHLRDLDSFAPGFLDAFKAGRSRIFQDEDLNRALAAGLEAVSPDFG